MTDRRTTDDRRTTAPNVEALYLRIAADRDRRTADRRIAAPNVEPSASRWRTRAGLVFIVLALGLAGSSDRATARPRACTDDMACWTWPIMGNYSRGIITVGGRYLVVGPCRFQRVALAERIDWRLTPNLRGDALATFAGCRMTRDRARGRGARWRG